MNLTQIELLRKLLRHGATDRVVRILSKFRPSDIAEVTGSLSPPERRAFLTILFEHGDFASILTELPDGILREILEESPDERVVFLLDELAPDDALAVASLIEAQRLEQLLAHVRPGQRERLEHMMRYPPRTAGSIMTSQMITVGEHMSVQQVIEQVRAKAQDTEFVFYLYVVDEAGTFLGVLPIRRLIIAPPQAEVGQIMVVNPIAVFATADQEEVARITAQYDLLAVPVVDENFRLLGAITVDDVIDVLRAEATEDMYLMQGLSDEDRVYSPVSQSVKKRFPWMVLNLVTAFGAASVIGLFEESIAKVVILATFMPVVAGMGGNGGTQTLTVMTRAIALGRAVV